MSSNAAEQRRVWTYNYLTAMSAGDEASAKKAWRMVVAHDGLDQAEADAFGTTEGYSRAEVADWIRHAPRDAVRRQAALAIASPSSPMVAGAFPALDAERLAIGVFGALVGSGVTYLIMRRPAVVVTQAG